MPVPLRFDPRRERTPPRASALRREVDGEVLFDAASRGRYSDRRVDLPDRAGGRGRAAHRGGGAHRAADRGRRKACRSCRAAPAPRSAARPSARRWSSTTRKYLNRVRRGRRRSARRAVVQPGVVLDRLNAQLRPHGLWFPVDVSTSAQATLGGMAGNNSCGSRSIRYGNMVHNVLGHRRVARRRRARSLRARATTATHPRAIARWSRRSTRSCERESDEIEARWPKVLRRVQGYNLDRLAPDARPTSRTCWSAREGTLAWFERLHLEALADSRRTRCWACAISRRFYHAMDAAQHIVKLGPGRGGAGGPHDDRPGARQSRVRADRRRGSCKGEPDAILLVEFAGEDRDAQVRRLQAARRADGRPRLARQRGRDHRRRAAEGLWEVRKAGLNIMMSMKGDGKPVSFIEDCAVPLEHLAEYTDAADARCSRSTAPTAPGTRTPRSAACTCARCST